jgi:hypothetical protein
LNGRGHNIIYLPHAFTTEPGAILSAIRELMHPKPPPAPKRRSICFTADLDEGA